MNQSNEALLTCKLCESMPASESHHDAHSKKPIKVCNDCLWYLENWDPIKDGVKENVEAVRFLNLFKIKRKKGDLS